MQAIILAAGMGKRLRELTKNNTKCMIEVNGKTLIERMLNQLDSLALNRIVIVVGYESQKLIDFINTLDIKTDIKYVSNEIYDKTNNIYSLFLAKDYLAEDDTILLESDIIFDTQILKSLIEDKRDTLALVDKYESWMDGTVVKLNEKEEITAFISKKEFVFHDIPDYFKTVNIYKLEKQFLNNCYIPFLTAYMKTKGMNEYYEQVLKIVVGLNNFMISGKIVDKNYFWYEIDDVQDLDIASSMFASDEQKLEAIERRYGGFWRYPKMLDFCYLVNPYFPPRHLMDEIKANFESLLTQYPSGMNVQSLLASKNFQVKQNHIVVGNGAAEIIKAIMKVLPSPFGYVRPTFEEYPNRTEEETCIFYPKNDGFVYTAEEFINFFDKTNVKTLLLINPDNPSGNYIPKKELIRILNWAKVKDIFTIIDESFVDFSDELDGSLIDETIIENYPNLVIVKSISKSYGVPGLRLGIAVSSDDKLIAHLKKDLSIWNINSFGEFYLQIEEKYHSDYLSALECFRKERQRFYDSLCEYKGIIVYPSQANYFLIKLKNIPVKRLASTLLSKYNILIKDLTKKKGIDDELIRISIRNETDNNRLLEAFKDLLL